METLNTFFLCLLCSCYQIKTEKERMLKIFDIFIFHLHRSRREAELNELQRCVEEETRRHEVQLSELRVKHSAALDNLQEQLDNSKRVGETNAHQSDKTCTYKHAPSLIVCHPCSPSGASVPGEGQGIAGGREAEFDSRAQEPSSEPHGERERS